MVVTDSLWFPCPCCNTLVTYGDKDRTTTLTAHFCGRTARSSISVDEPKEKVDHLPDENKLKSNKFLQGKRNAKMSKVRSPSR